MKIKINPVLIIITFLLIMISFTWYYNYDKVETILDEQYNYLDSSEIKELQIKGILLKSINPINDRISRSRNLSYYRKKTPIPLIYIRDTISGRKWTYKKH